MSTSKAVLLDAKITTTTSNTACGGPRQHLVDVSFPGAPVVVSSISFCNYYAAAITVSHTCTCTDESPQAHTGGHMPSWQIVVPKLTLMADPHCEDDAQCYHELTQEKHFAPDFDHRRVVRLRICCIQPSPSWREYGVRHLRFYCFESALAPALHPPPPLSSSQREMAAKALQQLVGLGGVASEIRQAIASGMADCTPKINTAADGDASSLTSYIVGEWSDELRLSGIDAALSAPSPMVPARPSSAKLSGGAGSSSLARS